MSIFLNSLGIVCALGVNKTEVSRNLFLGQSPGMQKTDRYSFGKSVVLGVVNEELPLIGEYGEIFNTRNNQLLALAANQIKDDLSLIIKKNPEVRVAVIIGTSTSGMSEGEDAICSLISFGKFPRDFDLSQQELGAPSSFLSKYLNLNCPNWVISTACTSSAKAIASAARMLNADLFDVVVCGGVDSLCKFTVAGFSSLESLSSDRCQPFSLNRRGINIGEGAAIFLMTKSKGGVELAGWGESSDGHHISAPDPKAIGPILAVNNAIKMAKISTKDVGYVNLHGTATIQNDSMEALLVNTLFDEVWVSSTKPLTGHTLGAAGAIEAALSWITIVNSNGLPPHLWDGIIDESLPSLKFVPIENQINVNVIVSNNFAFGGNNTSLVLKALHE